MNEQTQFLRNKYDALVATRRSIREKVKERYKEVIKEEIAREIRELDVQFAHELVAMKNAGMRRVDIAKAVRSNAHNHIQYFLNLAGSEGFQQGRPSTRPQHGRKGFEIVDVESARVKIWSLLGKPVHPFEAIVVFGAGNDKVLAPVDGSLNARSPELAPFWSLKDGDFDNWRKVRLEVWDMAIKLFSSGLVKQYDQASASALNRSWDSSVVDSLVANRVADLPESPVEWVSKVASPKAGAVEAG